MGGVEEASLSGFYSKPHIHTCVYVYRTHMGLRGHRGVYTAPSLGPKSIQSTGRTYTTAAFLN